MTAMILPGTYIEVRAEGLIAPGQVTVGNVGVVGTAVKGPVDTPVLLSNYNDAIATFGSYDSFTNPTNKNQANNPVELTLVRALQLVFANGASTVYAMRVVDANVTGAPNWTGWAKATLASGNDDCVKLTAKSAGTWAKAMIAIVENPSDTDVLMSPEEINLTAATQVALAHKSKATDRNRASIRHLDGTTTIQNVVQTAPKANQKPPEVQFSAGNLIFGDAPEDGSVVTANYQLDKDQFRKVTIALDATKESYLVLDGNMLVSKVNDPQSGSTLVTAEKGSKPAVAPDVKTVAFTGGADGAGDAVYKFDSLLDVDAHIIIAAGQSDKATGAALDAHCQQASTDIIKRDRIAVVGSVLAGNDRAAYVNKLIGNTLASDRVVFVAPGFKATSDAAGDQPLNPITLPGAYAAAVIAGMLAGLPPHVSLTNKPVAVSDLEVKFTNPELTELVQNRVTALELNHGFRVLRGQTTDDGAFREITTRRIVDYAKYGVRAAAQPFIGLLNNDRVRSALRATINSFLQGMKDDEMLVNYTLDVSATRDEQIKGIVQVTMTLQPVFSINFIRVTMILS